MPEAKRPPGARQQQRSRRDLAWRGRRGVRLWGFVFPASPTHLDRLCRRYLNQDPTGQVAYRPLAPYVTLTCAALDVAIDGPQALRRLRPSVECELAIWVPVEREGAASPMFFLPYVFTNDPLAAVEGREVFGLPKEVAFLRQRAWPRCFGVDGYVLDEFGPQSVGRWERILSIERIVRRAKQPRPWQEVGAASAELRRLLVQREPHAAAFARTAWAEDAWPPHGPIVQLKQFPDCDDGRYSCYSSIVEAASRLSNIKSGAVLADDYELRFRDLASHPLAADLGVHDGARAILAYTLEADLDLVPGQEVWKAPRRKPLGAAPGPLDQLTEALADMPRRLARTGKIALDQVRRALLPTNEPPATEPAPRRVQRRPGKRERIVILGGGVGAMSAAFALTQEKGWRKRYDITVYQLGWRLGGKGASGRDMDAAHRRIEEHGLHGWFGFYDNAFEMMRQCYRELPDLAGAVGGADPLRWGFEPQEETLLEEFVDGRWKHHRVRFPPNPLSPGRGPTPTVADFIAKILDWMWDRLRSEAAAGTAGPAYASALSTLAPRIDAFAQSLGGGGIAGTLAAGAVDVLVGELDRLTDALWEQLAPLLAADDDARRLFIAMDFGAAVVRGLIRDVLPNGFDALEQEASEWLADNGARPETVDSDWARVLYAMSFAFHDGDVQQPRTAAGAAIRSVLRMLLDYRGAFLWKMKGGMGDMIFAPLYRVLRGRGVKFKFFHRVRELHVGPDRTIGRISIGRQATPTRDYPYLVKVKDLWCWPNQPDYTQLAEGEAIEELRATGAYVNFESAWSAWGPAHEDLIELRHGIDFDRVVLGISLGALPTVCKELIDADPRWRDMVDRVKTIRTQSFQWWLKPTLAESGYVGPSPLMTAYVRPFETWGDMTHTLRTENWPADSLPGQVAYMCGPMPDSPEPPHYSDWTFPKRMRDEVFVAMREYATKHAAHLWPNLAQPGGLKWDQLIDPRNGQGQERLRGQFWIANIDPTERYVLSVPGSTSYRLRSDRSRFANLYLAGDWTYTGLNIGCVEAAVMSGLRAAAAIAGKTPDISGEANDSLPEQGEED